MLKNSLYTSGQLIYIQWSYSARQTWIVENVFIGNAAMNSGGVISASNQTHITLIGNILTGNTAVNWGGTIHATTNSSIILKGNNFSMNSAEHGGAINCWQCTINVTGNNIFEINSCNGSGGAINVKEGELKIANDTSFYGNRAMKGGAIFLTQSHGSINGTDAKFINNTLQYEGTDNIVQSRTHIIIILDHGSSIRYSS